MDEKLFRRASLIRQFEEKLLTLFAEGKLSGTVHTCIGQELCALAVMDQLSPNDWVFSNHRCHGHYLARTEDVTGLLAEIMGKPSGICAGRGGSQHICGGRFLSNGVQGGGVPIAAGCALALQRSGQEQEIAVAYIGDGTLGQGVVYETLNLAAKLPVPLLLVLEHNGYAQSTDTRTTIAGDIRGRFEAFGWKFWEGSIWEEPQLFTTARHAVEFVRKERKPAVLVITCYRLKAHSKGDDNRALEEIARYESVDPLRAYERANPEPAARIHADCAATLERSLVTINGSADGGVDDTVGVDIPAGSREWIQIAAEQPAQRVVEKLRAGLRRLLANDPRVILLGEDLEDPYGGAFKASKGLSTEFPGRVRNTPISEAALVGFGNGLALAGARPIVEIMFGDFTMLAADQLVNQGSKFAYMYNQQVEVPLIVRTPMGGKRGYGATHSQSLEKHFLGTPGLHVVAINSIFDPGLLLERVHQHLRGPCLFIENKLLYSAPVKPQSPDGRIWEHSDAPLPTLRLAAADAQVTVVTYGGMVDEVQEAVREAFLENEIVAEIIVPTQLCPLDVEPILESVARSTRLLVVEEGQGFAGFGAEVLAICAERNRGVTICSARISAAPHPIPCSRELERSALPDQKQVLAAILELVEVNA